MKRFVLMAFFALGSLATASLAADADVPGKIEGMAISRPNGQFLGVQVVSNTFKLSFYNEKKKPIAADVASAVFWWPVHYQPNSERTELTPSGDGKSMASGKTVRAPLSFVLHISLFVPEKKDPVESYTIDFQG